MDRKILTFISFFMFAMLSTASFAEVDNIHGDIYHPRVPEYRSDTQILNIPKVHVFDDDYSKFHVQLRYVPDSNPIALDVIFVEKISGCRYDDLLRRNLFNDCDDRRWENDNRDKDYDDKRKHHRYFKAKYDPLLDVAYLVLLFDDKLYRAALYADPNQIEGARKRMLVHAVEFWKNYED